MAVALYAGSFDPIHLGHLGVIEQASESYDRVVVAVLANPAKSQGLFGADKRVSLVAQATRHLGNVSSVHHHGLTVDLARALGADVLIRAAHKEFDAEFEMASVNSNISGLATVLVPARAKTRLISSSLVRSLLAEGRLAAARDLVPPSVAVALADVRV